MEDGWNYVDVANYIGLVGVFVLRVMIFNEAAVVSKQLLSLTEDGFINMHRMSELKNMSLAITAVNSAVPGIEPKGGRRRFSVCGCFAVFVGAAVYLIYYSTFRHNNTSLLSFNCRRYPDVRETVQVLTLCAAA